MTGVFPAARVGRLYGALVNGRDADRGDRLSMSIAGLPDGIGQGLCWSALFGKPRITCYVFGVARKMGVYPVTINLADNHDAKVTRILPFLVRK
ncbi:MAG: hypothetical protein UY10_C0007G0013 [Microgenomates group bacterium GW2011_GWA2_47_8]|nr:MAG: hypothetical protein UY10_C0007G0013 [Microgenomates group bacterium GW2011_GWA2_47_8]